ncbi:hypothetical protein [Mucilaginibacter sp. OK098]|uniref:hypothetical protein n=1 Tax=Mucilaginibacter sp. OK098 TaxID=1855297 RepID=UPI000916E2CF|nr:hypothetical protein [Mucilaginibacter sp. OK098]SHN07404.1 hypothetical protein SAMN05216524_10537 [Mucilaginibacter sp. OK098]
MKKECLLIIAAFVSPFSLLAAPAPTAAHPDNTETWISFLPVIFFLLILIVTAIKLRKVDDQSSGLLAEKDKQAVQVAGANTDNPSPPQSTSRLIALLTGLVALVIGVCLTTFFMYRYFTDSAKPVDLSNLTTVIYGLGIGVLPYGFNKASAAIKSQ